jgi:hypothetical protein
MTQSPSRRKLGIRWLVGVGLLEVDLAKQNMESYFQQQSGDPKN